ncbi:MAG TPA: globin family protein [Thermoanaerobaculia bacterium]|jgi:hemoglobin-like flavoprotein|nr:globin family protein [Thermoanaerobaculia bacterium]
MNSKQIELVQASFDQVMRIADVAAGLFYQRLFVLDPSLRPMFRGDMKEQGKKLMDMIRTVVVNLRTLDRIVPGIRALGARHSGYGVRDEHYATVGAALLWTLGQGLGDAFTDDVRDAWTAAYTLLATTMKEAAAEVAA